ncbi:VWA domain-containing protein [Micromonospora echinaurantiaca]|uniref:vWA domain-containing protein n=1 Tax=Micromonospora echinaurantiaca TaxID=47857 RepID=UPI003722EB72
MTGNRGNLLPVYVLADESGSMSPYIDELNRGLASLHEALLGEPMAAAKVRFSILGFADDVKERLRLADLRRENELPTLLARGRTNYRAVFSTLRQRIPQDVQALKKEGYAVHRPAVFLLSDGQPTDDQWADVYRQLVDRTVTPCAPNVIACGIGDVEAKTILELATQPEYAFVAIAEVDMGTAIAQFCMALTTSIVESGRSLGSAEPELLVQQPAGFRMAIDVV